VRGALTARSKCAGGGGGCARTKVPGARAFKQRRCVRARATTARSNFLPRKLISARDGTIRSEFYSLIWQVTQVDPACAVPFPPRSGALGRGPVTGVAWPYVGSSVFRDSKSARARPTSKAGASRPDHAHAKEGEGGGL